MTVRAAVDLRTMVASVTIAALAAVLFFLLLAAIARPGGLQAGLATATHQTSEIETRLQSAGEPYAYPTHALCRDAPEAAEAKLRDRLVASAGPAVTLSNVSAVTGVSDEAAGGLVPITLQFDAAGRYDAVITLLDGLARADPEVFVDTVDLKSETSSVALKFTGRIYCSTPVPL